MNTLDKLSKKQLKQIIVWTLNDLDNAAGSTNYQKLDDKVKGWCAMLAEAVRHQIDKALKQNYNDDRDWTQWMKDNPTDDDYLEEE